MNNLIKIHHIIGFASSIIGHVVIFFILLYKGFFFKPNFINNEQDIIVFDLANTSLATDFPTQYKNLHTNNDTQQIDSSSSKKNTLNKKAENYSVSQDNNTELEKTPANDTKSPESNNKSPEPINPANDTKSPKPNNKSPEPKKPSANKTKSAETNKNSKENDSIDSILKNLQQSSDNKETKNNDFSEKKEEEKHHKSTKYNKNLPLSITEQQIIRNQIEKNWNILNLKHLKGGSVTLKLYMNPDGTIRKVDVKKVICYNPNQDVCKIIIENAIRAVWKSSPIVNLQYERYSIWQEYELLFDSQDLPM